MPYIQDLSGPRKGDGRPLFDFLAAPDIHPTDIVSYTDVLKLWRKHPLDRRQERDLRECLRDTSGYLDDPYNEPAWFNPALRQRLRLWQPSDDALRLLAGMPDDGGPYLNYGERALDLIFPPAEIAQAGKLVRRYVMKRNHRQEMWCDHGTLYTNRRRARSNIAVYHDLPSKPNGQPCVHICSRTSGHEAMIHARLDSLADWINLDDRAYWRERLRLCDIHFAKLGRAMHNRRVGGRRRTGWVGDHRIGYRSFHEAQGQNRRVKSKRYLHGCYSRYGRR